MFKKYVLPFVIVCAVVTLAILALGEVPFGWVAK